jgi:hypothetical protein
MRRRAASGASTPLYVRANITFVLLVSLTLLTTAAGVLHERSGAVFLSALSVFLIFAVGAWLGALNVVVIPK